MSNRGPRDSAHPGALALLLAAAVGCDSPTPDGAPPDSPTPAGTPHGTPDGTPPDSTPDGTPPDDQPLLLACLPGDSPPFGTGPECTQPPPGMRVIDFGVTALGASAVRIALVRNAGEGALIIRRMTSGGSSAFSLATNGTGVVPPGGSAPVVVVYRPTMARQDTGTVTIESDDPAQPELVIDLRGEGRLAPVADAGGDRRTEPLAGLTLDGSASHDPDGEEPLTYRWTFADVDDANTSSGAVLGSRAALKSVVDTPECQAATSPFPAQCQPWQVRICSSDCTSAPGSGLGARAFIDLAGTYHVELQVTDTAGLTNVDPEIVRVEAIPPQDLHIELVWDNFQSDLDLHLTRAGGALLSDDDCFFRNCSPDRPPARPRPEWCVPDGPATGPDDPSLDLDDIDGFGPEILNIAAPCADTYHAYVHYWSSHGHPLVLSNATVRVWCEGELRAAFFQPLTADEQLWDVATVTWPGCVTDEVGAVRTRPP